MAVEIPGQAIRDAQSTGWGGWTLLLAIAGPESSWRADAIGDGGCSKGYLQFNQCGGLGQGHSDAELLDGPSNMRLGAQYIGGRLATGAGLYDALQPWSTRDAALALYQRIQNEGIAGVTGPGGEGPSGGAGAALLILVGLYVALSILG